MQMRMRRRRARIWFLRTRREHVVCVHERGLVCKQRVVTACKLTVFEALLAARKNRVLNVSHCHLLQRCKQVVAVYRERIKK